jgi:hypothetical protein
MAQVLNSFSGQKWVKSMQHFWTLIITAHRNKIDCIGKLPKDIFGLSGGLLQKIDEGENWHEIKSRAKYRMTR